MDIIALLQCLQPTLTATTIRQFSRIILALFAMTGRVTMLGISRWAGTGGSYRTIQRWFYTTIPWAQAFVHFFRQHLFQANAIYILAGINASSLPRRAFLNKEQANPGYESDLAAMMRTLEKERGVIVYFKRIRRWYLPSADQLLRSLPLRVRESVSDGILIEAPRGVDAVR